VLLAPGRVVQVQDAAGGALLLGQLEGAGFPGLVAGHGEVVGNLVAAPPQDGGDATAAAARVFPAVGLVGGDDAVIRVHHDAGLGQAVEEGDELVELAGRI